MRPWNLVREGKDSQREKIKINRENEVTAKIHNSSGVFLSRKEKK